MVDASIQRRGVLRPDRRRGIVGRVDTRSVGQGIQRRNLPRQRIEQTVIRRHIQPIKWHRAPWYAAHSVCEIHLLRCIGADAAGIETSQAVFGEIADALLRRRHHGCDRDSLPYLQRFIIAKEEGLTLHDRAAQTSSELVLPELLLRQLCPSGEVVVAIRIESIVPEKFKQRAVEIVASRLRQNVDHTARCAADFGAIKIRQNFKFLNGVNRRPDSNSANESLVVVHAIDQVVVGDRVLPVHGIRRVQTAVVRACTGGQAVWRSRTNTGNELRQLNVVASVQW